MAGLTHRPDMSALQDSYDTFGDAAADQARLRAAAEASARPSIIPGPLLDELIVPVASSIGTWLPPQGLYVGWADCCVQALQCRIGKLVCCLHVGQ